MAPRVLPAPLRKDLAALYGFARLVDDTGDEAPGDRLRLLDELERQLELVWSGTPSHPVLRQLVPTVRRHELPPEPFHKLVEANRRDQVVRRYPTFEELLGYCELSANPVGHLVLHVLGAATPRRLAASDRVCTALQLVEHLQDVREDYQRGRIYLPQEDLDRFGVRPRELGAPRASPALRALVAFEAHRARELLEAGAALVGTLGGWARAAVAGFVAGGRAALRAIERADHDVLGTATRAARWRLGAAWLRTWARGG